MSLSKADHTTLGRALYEAMRSEVPIKPLIQSHPDITIEDAYQISRVMLSLRMDQDGETIVGKKNRRYLGCSAENVGGIPA